MKPDCSPKPSLPLDDHCPSCGVVRADQFCPRCGEKRLSPEDASVKHHIADLWESLIQFDGKFLRSLRQIVNPGRITEDHFAGRRIKILKPLQLFLLINAVYFFALESADIFFNRWSAAKEQSFAGISIQSLGESRMRSLGIDEAEFKNKHDATARQLSRALVIILIPFVALGSWALFGRSKPYYAQHLTFTAHILGFWLLWMMAWILAMKYGFEIYRGSWIWVPIRYVFLAWLIVACRRAFADHWGWSIAKGLLLFWVIQWLQFNVYRNIISVITIYWI